MGDSMKRKDLRIGLALSGGGMRAAVFHLGVLKGLAQHQLLAYVSHISSVSGASLCMGLLYGENENQWPSDNTFLEVILPRIKEKICSRDIQWTSLLRLLVEPYYWDKKVNLLANVMEKRWKISGCLQDVDKDPLWTINTTAYETGKDFRISRVRMGDKESGYVEKPTFQITHAMAASAGFPILIGPYKFKTSQNTWVDERGHSKQPQDKVLHLWDGGVYDNMGLDPLFHIGEHNHFVGDITYLIVSNASGNIEHQTRKYSFSIENLKRLLDINRDQVESLKSRSVQAYFKEHQNGVYLKIGSDVRKGILHSSLCYEQKEHLLQTILSWDQVKRVSAYPTDLRRMKQGDFDRILRHGQEVLECQLQCLGHFGK